MYNIFYIIGVVVVVFAILGYLGLRQKPGSESSHPHFKLDPGTAAKLGMNGPSNKKRQSP